MSGRPSTVKSDTKVPDVQSRLQGYISWGIHGIPKVSLGPIMPYYSTPCECPPLKRPYGRFKGGHP
jgi:hypothetical protein